MHLYCELIYLLFCMIWFQCLLLAIWKSWKKVQFCKKWFWWQVFRIKDEQKGLNQQMVMLINKKINDKNNSKLKTFQIIKYDVKQSKMMFLFIFVLFQTTFIIDFIEILFLEYLMMNIICWLLYSLIYSLWLSWIF